jgi:hypothetical protein
VLVLVDADSEICIPHCYLLDSSNLQVLLTLSPRSSEDRHWLTQSVGDEDAVFVMELWLPEEFLVPSFVYSSDLIIYFA